MAELGRVLRERIDGFHTLGVQPEVALRLIELGKDPQAELEDYVRILSMSRSQSAKLLALANSSWFSPRQPITTIKRAITMIGLTPVRLLSISYCLEGLHHALELEPEDAGAYWQAALCVAIAAHRIRAEMHAPDADDAFAVALLQDMAVGVMAELDATYIARLGDPQWTLGERLIYEVQRFGLDHAAAGAQIARMIGLPQTYQSAIATHHGQLDTDVNADPGGMQSTARIIAWLPHDIRCWAGPDAERFAQLLEEQLPSRWASHEAFFSEIQAQFAEWVGQLSPHTAEPTNLRQLFRHASAQNAAHVTQKVGEAHSALVQSERLSGVFDTVVSDHLEAEHRADHDPLTRLLNREGFQRRVTNLVMAASGTEIPIGLAFFDCDRFKATNDAHGHDAGDALLRAVVARLRASMRDNDLLCRWGGDEFVLLFMGLTEEIFVKVARRAQHAVARDPVIWQGVELSASVTGGLIWLDAFGPQYELADLVSQADANLYLAKRQRRGSLVFKGKPLTDASSNL